MANAKATDGPVGLARTRSYRVEGGDLARGFGVQQGTADDQAKISGAATRVLGVASEAVTLASGLPVTVVMHGECIAIAGGAVNAGDMVKTDGAGKWIAANAADVETGGKALTSAAADTDEFVMFVSPNQKRS
jgi:hypothetical protein